MRMAVIPIGAATIGFGVGLAIAGWRGDLAAHDAARSPPFARPAMPPSSTGHGPSLVAYARSLRPAPSPRLAAPGRSASPASQPLLQMPPGVLTPEAGTVDGGLPDATRSAIGEPEDPDRYLEAADRAAAHSARSH